MLANVCQDEDKIGYSSGLQSPVLLNRRYAQLQGYTSYIWKVNMEWIIKNKEWLFSGVAIAIPIALFGWIFSARTNKQVQKGGNDSKNIQVGGSLRIDGNKNDK